LLIETGLLEFLLPELAQAWSKDPEEPENKKRIALFWSYLRALDESIVARGEPPSDAMILAMLLLPPLREALSPDAAPTHNMAQIVGESVQPILDRLKASRRDSELCRQILLTLRYLLPSSHPTRQRGRLANRPYYQDAVWLRAIVAKAEGLEPPSLADAPAVEEPAETAALDAELPSELLVDVDGDSGRDRRNRHRGRRPESPAQAPGPAPVQEMRRDGPAVWSPGPTIRTPIPNLDDLGILPLPRPAFLGQGGFGGRWAARSD
jgi:hypothetical protein